TAAALKASIERLMRVIHRERQYPVVTGRQRRKIVRRPAQAEAAEQPGKAIEIGHRRDELARATAERIGKFLTDILERAELLQERVPSGGARRKREERVIAAEQPRQIRIGVGDVAFEQRARREHASFGFERMDGLPA